MMLLRFWRRFESWSLALPLLCLAHFPNWLFAPRLTLARYVSWPVAAFWMTPLALLAYLIPLSCLAAWLLRRSLPERFVRRLIVTAAVLAVPLHAALLHFYVANPLCSRE
jgi:hypothetical protein